MKMTKRILVMLIVLALTLSMIPAALAATSGDKEVKAGNTTTVTFTYAGVKGAQGSVLFSNPDMFSDMTVTIASGYAGSDNISLDEGENGKFFYWSDKTGDFSITLSLTVASDAKAGDSCNIVCSYETTVDGENMDPEKSETVTITVAKEPTGGDDDKPENPGVVTEPTIDYTELKRQIGIAEGLVETDYTAESWANMLEALKAARDALASDSQAEVDAAAKALADAIAALVKVDYSKLIAAMEKVRELGETEELANLWLQMYDLFDEAKLALTSGDQAWVDELTQKILDLLAKIIEEMAAMKNPEQVTVEVPVEVNPTEPFCNINMHKVWPILFFVSLGLNAAFIVALIVMASKKKKKESDNTPLVDYDIGDDA